MNDYFFAEHSKEVLMGWAKRLSIFRYVRRCGGLADDGDSIQCAFSYKDNIELEAFLKSLSIEMVVYTSEPPKAEKGKSYTNEERQAFPSIIKGTEWIKQPGKCTINGGKAFIWCSNNIVSIDSSIPNPQWSVTEEHVINAELIEAVLQAVPLQIIEAPVDNERCLCKKYHP